MQLVELYEREGNWPHALACYDVGLHNCHPDNALPTAPTVATSPGSGRPPDAHPSWVQHDHLALQAGLGQCLRQLGCGPAAQLLLAGANLQQRHYAHHKGGSGSGMPDTGGMSDLLEQQYELAWRMGQWQLPDWVQGSCGITGIALGSDRKAVSAMSATPHPSGKGASRAATPAAGMYYEPSIGAGAGAYSSGAVRHMDGTQAGGLPSGPSPSALLAGGDGSQGSQPLSRGMPAFGAAGMSLDAQGGTCFNHALLHSLRALRQGDTQRFSSLTAQAVAGKSRVVGA
jgi:hypothetical protein